MRRLFLTTAIALIAPVTVWADDAALILGTERYEQLGRTIRATDVVSASGALEDLGFAVQVLPNGRADAAAAAVNRFVSNADGADHMLVVLSGRFVTDGRRTWYMTADAPVPDLFNLSATALSVESLMQVLGDAPGHAVLMLGAEAATSQQTFGPWLRGGVGELDIPQGVTVIQGEPRDVADVLLGSVVLPATDLAAAVANNRRLSIGGFAPRSYMFIADAPPAPQVLVTPQTPAPDTIADAALWDGARALDTMESYRDYLRRYPAGLHAAEAEAAIAAIIAEPDRGARLAEESMTLSRDQRRQVQRNLTLLSYDTRGIDGIFGPGTRRAIANWQQQNGFSQTTYLTTEQINRLDAQASRRAAELESQAEAKRLEEARLDRAYWEETGAKGDEPGYRAYLSRYPDGQFAELAADRLALIEQDKRQAAQAVDKAAWDSARQADTVAAYNTYLRAYPQGAFRADAQARITALTQSSADANANAAAAAAEAQLALNPIAARLVEARLQQLGLNPGPVDGVFDDATRRALRRYQRDRGLDVTGYLNEPTVVRLLADSVVRGR